MIEAGIEIDLDNWQFWQMGLVNKEHLHGLLLDAEIFEKKTEVGTKFERKALLVRNLLPEDAEAYFVTAEKTRKLPVLYEGLARIMAQAQDSASASLFSLRTRLDRMEEEQAPARLERLTEWLAKLLAAPVDQHFDILLPVRFPAPFPTSQELPRALQLCTSVAEAPMAHWEESGCMLDKNQATLGICADIYPEEGAKPADLFQSGCTPYLKAVCFHYQVSSGETLFDDEQQAWAEILAAMGFQGAVLFCPADCPPARIPEICTDADAWADFYLSSQEAMQ